MVGIWHVVVGGVLLVKKIFVICHIIKLHYIAQLIAPLVNTELLRFTVMLGSKTCLYSMFSMLNVFYQKVIQSS